MKDVYFEKTEIYDWVAVLAYLEGKPEHEVYDRVTAQAWNAVRNIEHHKDVPYIGNIRAEIICEDISDAIKSRFNDIVKVDYVAEYSYSYLTLYSESLHHSDDGEKVSIQTVYDIECFLNDLTGALELCRAINVLIEKDDDADNGVCSYIANKVRTNRLSDLVLDYMPTDSDITFLLDCCEQRVDVITEQLKVVVAYAKILEDYIESRVSGVIVDYNVIDFKIYVEVSKTHSYERYYINTPLEMTEFLDDVICKA